MKNQHITMPALALRGLVIFPGMILHFDIARDRSINAVEEAIEHNDRRIFLSLIHIFVKQGKDEINKGFKPPIKPINIDLSQYDTIILGTPVWWYTFAPAVKTFIESNNLAGKTIYPVSYTHLVWL